MTIQESYEYPGIRHAARICVIGSEWLADIPMVERLSALMSRVDPAYTFVDVFRHTWRDMATDA